MRKKEKLPQCYAFTDGSYNPATGIYGFGGFLSVKGKKEIISGSGNDPDMASMRNVAGEILGATEAVKKAVEYGCKELTVYYDYEGVSSWATGKWKTNRNGTRAYAEFIRSLDGVIRLHFVHVKGHSGIDGNEEADSIAKKAAGIN